MPIYQLSENIVFPNPNNANKDGILAIGGDLCPERLLNAYTNGIFPWYSEGDPIIWWSPKKRFVLFPEKIKVSKSLKKVLNKKLFNITFNKCFKEVITKCGEVRSEEGTWINPDMIEGYTKLHELGFAHSIESWSGDKLVGGLYGVAIGKIFYGESMFSLENNASKVAFATCVEELTKKGFLMIDCQVHTKYLESFGAELIERELFFEILRKGFKFTENNDLKTKF